MVLLQNCDSELSYIVAKLFNMCLRESCFVDCWKASLVVAVINDAGERCEAKNYCLVSRLCVFSKVFEKFVINRHVDHLKIFDIISCFLSNIRLQVVLYGKFSQDDPVNAGVLQDSILGPTLLVLYISDLLVDCICNIAIYADDITLL